MKCNCEQKNKLKLKSETFAYFFAKYGAKFCVFCLFQKAACSVNVSILAIEIRMHLIRLKENTNFMLIFKENLKPCHAEMEVSFILKGKTGRYNNIYS